MHERTQRAVARLLFVFCCAVPTFLVFSSILICWSPWYQSRRLTAIEDQLSLETGVVFRIGECSQLAPGKYLLSDVELRDPETGDVVARCRKINFFQGEEHVGMDLRQAEVRAIGLGRIASLIHDRLLSRPEHTLRPISVVAFDVNLVGTRGSLPLGDASIEVKPESDGVRLLAKLGAEFRRAETRLTMDLFRDRSGPVPRSEWVFSTEGTALPCSAFADYFPLAERLGSEASFHGVVRCSEQDDGWAYDLASCRLEGVNLSDVSRDLPYRMSGEASLRLRRCLIQPGRSVNVVGGVTAKDALVDPLLLLRLHDETSLLVDATVLQDTRQMVDCNVVDVHFEMKDQSLRLKGVCQSYDADRYDIAICSRGAPIAWTNPSAVIQSDRVTAALTPRGSVLQAWNQVFLPSLPDRVSDETGFYNEPEVRIRNVQKPTGDKPLLQR